MSEVKALPRLQTYYREVVREQMLKEFGYKNPFEVPALQKIVINMGVGEAAGDQKKLDAAVAELTLISGQKPVKTIAKKAIAGFKIRAGLPIGCKVTLRKANACTSSSIAWSPSRCRACVTSAASRAIRDSTGVAILPWASRNRSFSLRSSMTRSMQSVAWTSSS